MPKRDGSPTRGELKELRQKERQRRAAERQKIIEPLLEASRERARNGTLGQIPGVTVDFPPVSSPPEAASSASSVLDPTQVPPALGNSPQAPIPGLPGGPPIAPGSKIIKLPHLWVPRRYQLSVLQALDSGIRRASTVWHRRAGKDSCAINYTACQTQRRVGTYWHVLPTQRQARKVVWEGIDKQGRRIIDQAFPKEMVKRKRDDEMTIEFHNGSIWRLVGGDNYDSLVGSNVVGVVFSEFSITDPMAWNYVRPILVENDGWAWFIFTPRGNNHAKKLHDMAIQNPAWFAETLDVTKTGAVSLTAIEEERLAGMPDEMIEQEFYCSFTASNVGAIYGHQMAALEKNGRITRVPYDARYPVETWWDLGYADATAITFVQRVNNGLHVIDYHEERNKALPHYCSIVNVKGYAYNRHVGPHDLEQTEYGSGETRKAIAANHGIQFVVAPKLPIADGIQAAKAMLTRCAFDSVKCERLIDALKEYQFEWDEEKKMLSQKPRHDWTSHPADSIRTGAVAPEHWGIVPDWMVAEQAQQSTMQGHNGGPPMDDYDPLAALR